MLTPARSTKSSTHCFAFSTASVDEVVWDTLTRGAAHRGWLHGLCLQSEWRTGSSVRVTASSGDTFAVGGSVLHASPPRVLAYSFQAAPDDPCTYLLWQLRATAGGCVVRLDVDDVECPDDDESAEDAWLPVLAALQACLTPA